MEQHYVDQASGEPKLNNQITGKVSVVNHVPPKGPESTS